MNHGMFLRAIDFIVYRYKKAHENELIKRLGLSSKESNVRINYPFVISHPELISIGKGTTILEYSRIQPYPEITDQTPHVRIGSRCFLGYRLCILAGADISIGDDVLFASDVSIVSHNHGINPDGESPYIRQKLRVLPIKIGNNCWVGDKAIILPGVEIGNGCVIGGGAVVSKSIPEYSIAVGNPARVIKRYNFESNEWIRV